NQRIVNHLLQETPLRVSSHRGLGSYANIFAIESFVDELAHATGADPMEFRLRHLEDERAKAVIQSAAKKSGWEFWKKSKTPDRGMGMGFSMYKNRASYVAVVVDLHVNRGTGQIFMDQAFIACDSGEIVNPDGVANQLEGAFLQSASWTLKEQVSFDREGIISTDWYSYPILRFPDAPRVDVTLLNQPGSAYMGVGEGAMGPIPAAIANAVFDAVGVRLREIPFRPDKVKKTLLLN
ncbi:MAG: molybdopterin-dependent oxidoreductase, partial [Proteobacteria bacterium]|nr:molybdopterin-dependent oxidoreductase [Pseudomonadota bacterium]